MDTQQFLFQPSKLRRSNGQFCTREQKRVELVDNENKRLRMEKEKYYRGWFAASKKASRLERELNELKKKIGGLI